MTPPNKKAIEKRRARSDRPKISIMMRLAAFWALFWTVVWISSGFNMVGFWWFLLFGSAPFFFLTDIFKRKEKDDFSVLNQGFESRQIENIQSTIAVIDTQNNAATPLHKQIMTDAKSSITQIKSASNVASGALGDQLRKMVHSLEIVEKGLDEDASKLSQVQRLFTYYVPATADILKARGKAAGANDEKRISEIDTMINRLEAAFADFAARIMGEDARSLEIDIKLLSQSLAAEFDQVESKR